MQRVETACEDVRKELSVLPAGGSGPCDTHLAQCDACRAWLADIERLEARIQGWRAVEPPEALQARIAAAVAAPNQSSWRKYLTLWKENLAMQRLSYTLAVAAVAICALFFFVNGQAATAYERMALAVSHVKSAHMIVWYNTAKTGPVRIEKVEEVWYENRNWRKRYGDRTDNDRIIRGSTYYAYDPTQRKVVASRETAPQITDFSLQALAGSYMPIGAHPHAELVGNTVKNGRRLQEVDLDLSNQGERMLFWVDPATGLPASAEKQDLDYSSGQWVVNGRFAFEFNQPLPASLFDPASLAQAHS